MESETIILLTVNGTYEYLIYQDIDKVNEIYDRAQKIHKENLENKKQHPQNTNDQHPDYIIREIKWSCPKVFDECKFYF